MFSPPWKPTAVHNEEENRFEIHQEGRLALMEYLINKRGQVFVTHTEVPESLAGQGHGRVLAKAVLQWLDDAGLKVHPICPFFASFLRRHPEYHHLLDRDVYLRR
jgi:predicted GNAT family acetyltransferase